MDELSKRHAASSDDDEALGMEEEEEEEVGTSAGSFNKKARRNPIRNSNQWQTHVSAAQMGLWTAGADDDEAELEWS